MTPAALSGDLLLKLQLREFYEEYAACLDSGDYAGWPDFFTDDATYRITGYENHDAGLAYGPINCFGIGMIRDRALAIRETTVYEPRRMRRMVSGVRVCAVTQAEVRSEAGFAVIECLQDRDPRVAMVGRSVDRIVQAGGRLRFAERICVYDNDRILQGLILPI